MEVRLMMPDAVFSEHANDNTEKSRKFCHVITYLYYTLSDFRISAERYAVLPQCMEVVSTGSTQRLRTGWAYPRGGLWVSVGVPVGKTVHE
jgi:hypothetical protein